MGQTETSMTSQNSIENLKLNETENTSKKDEKKPRHYEERSSKKTRNSSSVTANKSTFKYFKTNLASNTTDVELIVRKKLITTTTTTTMSPLEANNLLNNAQSFSDTSLNENLNSIFKKNELINDSINNNNNNNVVMERTIQNANPASTTDAVANLIQDLNSQRVSTTNGNTITASNSNQDIDEDMPKHCSLKDVDTNKRISTVKKEQLEYEFRIKPKQDTPVNNIYCLKSSSRTDMKLRKKKYKFSFKKSDQAEGNTEDSVSSVELVYKRYFCCGIKCCRLAYHTDHENESNEFNDENMQRSEFDLSLESGAKTQEPKQPSSRFSSNFFCSNRKSFAKSNTLGDENNKQDLNQKRNNFFRQSFNTIFCCCVMKNAKNDENEMPHGGSSFESPSNMNSSINQKLNDIRHNQRNDNDNSKEDANSDYDIASNPPITCIRVLRPSNDLTPVRFDSHYNIIQAYIDNENEAGGEEAAQASSEIYSNMPVTDVPENFELIDNEGDYYFDTS